MEKMTFFRGGNFGKMSDNEKRESLIKAMNALNDTKGSLFAFVPDVSTIITGFIEKNKRCYPITLLSNIKTIKDVFQICFPLFYSSLKEVDDVTIFLVSKDGFDDFDKNEFGISLNTQIISFIKDNPDYDIDDSEVSADKKEKFSNFMSYIMEANYKINYNKNSKTFEEISEELELKESLSQLLRKEYTYTYEIEYDRVNNEYNITEYDFEILESGHNSENPKDGSHNTPSNIILN